MHPVNEFLTAAAVAFCATLAVAGVAQQLLAREEQSRLRRERAHLEAYLRQPAREVWIPVGRVPAAPLCAVNAMQVYSPEMAGEHEIGVN